MLSQPSVGVSAGPFDPDTERLVEFELQTYRDEFALSISHYMARAGSAASIMLLGLWLLAPADIQILIYAVLMLLLALGAGFYPIFQRRGRTTAGLIFMYGSFLTTLTLSPLLIPSLMPANGIADVIAMMAALVLLGEPGSRWLVGALAFAYLLDVFIVSILEWSLFPPLEHRAEIWLTSSITLIVMLTAIMSIRLIVLGLGQQYRRAQRLNLELERQIRAGNGTQETLNYERNLLRTLIDTVPAYVYIKDTNSRFVDANLETALEMGAKNPDELIGKTDFDFFSAELAEKYFADEQTIVKTGQPILNMEERTFDHRTQQSTWLLTTKVPILNEQGEVTGLVGVGFDITDRRQAQEQMARERDLLRTLIDHIPDYIFIKDADGRFVNSNAAHNAVAQVKDADDLLGKNVFDVFPQPLAAQFVADDQHVLQTGQALVNVERISLDAKRQECTVLTTKVPLLDAEGKVTGLVGISRDITEHKRAEQQAVALAAERQRVALLREFIRDVSHDFRTPLSIIGTSAYLVRKTTDAAKLQQYSERIGEQISRLGLLMDNFVELANMEQEGAAVQFHPTDLNALVTTILEQSQPATVAKHQHVSYQAETDAELVLGDSLALTKAITNVVANAIHYTPEAGTITLRLYRQRESAVLEVADSGMGIAAEDLPHIFESFYRADSARSMESGGAGLGLTIAKTIVELMQGHIEVQSEVGRGSTFRIYLPLHG